MSGYTELIAEVVVYVSTQGTLLDRGTVSDLSIECARRSSPRERQSSDRTPLIRHWSWGHRTNWDIVIVWSVNQFGFVGDRLCLVRIALRAYASYLIISLTHTSGASTCRLGFVYYMKEGVNTNGFLRPGPP